MLQCLQQLVEGNSLTYEEARAAMDEIMSGGATDAQIAAFLTAMRMKGETVEEIAACAEGMRAKAARILPRTDVIDIVGTGGDCAGTFNVSTAAALITAAAGVPVAKHGNRSVSSRCGAADLFESLDVRIDLSPERSQAMLEQVGICFLFAPVYHTSMKHVAPARKQLGVRTIFNILGPLASPAAATLQLLGVYDEHLLEPMARVLMKLGVRRALVVHGRDGLDEITLTAPTDYVEVRDGACTRGVLDPRDFGFTLCAADELVGGDPAANAAILRGILAGERSPKRDTAVLNAAAALYVAGAAETIADGVALAQRSLDSGAAAALLRHMVDFSREAC